MSQIKQSHVEQIDSFMIDRDDVLEKGGRTATVGEVRSWKGTEYIKTDNGWKKHGKGKKGAKKPDSNDDSSAKDEGVSDNAKAALKEQFVRAKSAYNAAHGDSAKQKEIAGKLDELHGKLVESKVMKPSKDTPFWKQDPGKEGGKSEEKSVHISDMTSKQKLQTAKELGIENPENLSMKELDKQMIDKNIEKQLEKYKSKEGSEGDNSPVGKKEFALPGRSKKFTFKFSEEYPKSFESQDDFEDFIQEEDENSVWWKLKKQIAKDEDLDIRDEGEEQKANELAWQEVYKAFNAPYESHYGTN